MHEYRLEINMDHLQTFNSTLHDELRDNPSTLMPLFELAAKKVYEAMLVGVREFKEINDVQVILTSFCVPTSILGCLSKLLINQTKLH